MFKEWPVKITSIHPCNDLVVLGVKELEYVDNSEVEEDYLLCLDAGESSCAPDELLKITFWRNLDEHNVVIGEIRNGEEIERLAFLVLRNPPFQLNENGDGWSAIQDIIFS